MARLSLLFALLLLCFALHFLLCLLVGPEAVGELTGELPGQSPGGYWEALGSLLGDCWEAVGGNSSEAPERLEILGRSRGAPRRPLGGSFVVGFGDRHLYSGGLGCAIFDDIGDFCADLRMALVFWKLWLRNLETWGRQRLLRRIEHSARILEALTAQC